jgi:hypothetical protein
MSVQQLGGVFNTWASQDFTNRTRLADQIHNESRLCRVSGEYKGI